MVGLNDIARSKKPLLNIADNRLSMKRFLSSDTNGLLVRDSMRRTGEPKMSNSNFGYLLASKILIEKPLVLYIQLCDFEMV